MALVNLRLFSRHYVATHPYTYAIRSKRMITNASTAISPGQLVELECVDIGSGDGNGVCKAPLDAPDHYSALGSLVVFVPKTLPGERIIARIKNPPKKGFARGEKIETIKPHASKTEPLCPHFNQGCGGCTFQNLEYSAQLEWKQKNAQSTVMRLGKFRGPSTVFKPILGCGPSFTYQYRNKMEFSFEPNTKGTWHMGLHRPGSAERVLPIEHCHLQTNVANDMMQAAQALCLQHGIKVMATSVDNGKNFRRNTRERKTRGARGDFGKTSRDDRPQSAPTTGDPLLQHLVVRHSVYQDQYLLNFVTSNNATRVLKPIAAALKQQFGDTLHAIVNSVSDPSRPLAERKIFEEHVLIGENNSLTERILDCSYRISANSFFQVNTKQAERLFTLVLETTALQPTDTVLDLYCGTGSMTLLLAKKAAFAYGVEVVEAAVRDARENAILNEITNAEFHCSDASRIELTQQMKNVDVVVADPARGGMSAEVVELIKGLKKVRRLVYVSCNPSTQARDIALLCDQGMFELVSFQTVDMMPQTGHVETVAVLDRK